MAKKSSRRTSGKKAAKIKDQVVNPSRNLKQNLTMKDLEPVRKLLSKNLLEDRTENYIFPKNSVKIEELSMDEALVRINDIVKDLVNQIKITGYPSFNIPSRTSTNIIYDKDQDLLLLGNKITSKSLLTLTSAQETARLMKVLEIIHELLRKKKHMTKREVFYGDVNLFQEQKSSDVCIEDASTLLRTTRNSTGIVAKARGSAVGRLRLRDGNEIIDLDAQGSGSWSITPMIDQVDVIESDAEFILVLEKDAAMMRLIEEKWWRKYPCIALTAEGVGNVATRMFLKKINKKLRLPTFSLVDADPYGHYIYSVYIRGSKRLSYETPFLATPDMHLLGVLSRDLDEYGIDYSCR
ncbi:MAG: hypothetical protein ACTSVZ_01435, partial [Promethearchaeota archaeon]